MAQEGRFLTTLIDLGSKQMMSLAAAKTKDNRHLTPQ
jgi:hypothetical protein